MIDTSKYEGHTTQGWRRPDGSVYPALRATNNADAELMADAPLLLAEVKRLREGIEKALVELNTSAIAARERLKELIE